jgi:DNA-binding GntR family transcriptional regulator
MVNMNAHSRVSASPESTGASTHTTLRNQAYDRFCEKVLTSQLRAGQFVSQQELTLLLGMPLGAIREMIPRLEAARLITAVPKRGLQISYADLNLIRNAFHVRMMIEREAVSYFVRTASDEELNQIALKHEEILVRASTPEPDLTLDRDAMAVDWGLHNRMVDVMDNEILSDIYRVNTLHIKLIRIDSELARLTRVMPAMQEHMEFIKALQARDEKAAVALMMDHIAASRRSVLIRATDAQEPPVIHRVKEA